MESLGISPIEAYYQNIRVAGYADGGSREVFSYVDGVAIQRTKNILSDIQDFFFKYPSLSSLPDWNPMRDDISRNFSKTQRIENVQTLVNNANRFECKNKLFRKQLGK
jgi:hypothetical protein